MEYGLIGAKLGHSYSKIIHEMLCGYHYDLCPLPTEEEARAFLAKRQFKAINVTIPYKSWLWNTAPTSTRGPRHRGGEHGGEQKTACSTAITPIIWALPTCATPTA